MSLQHEPSCRAQRGNRQGDLAKRLRAEPRARHAELHKPDHLKLRIPYSNNEKARKRACRAWRARANLRPVTRRRSRPTGAGDEHEGLTTYGSGCLPGGQSRGAPHDDDDSPRADNEAKRPAGAKELGRLRPDPVVEAKARPARRGTGDADRRGQRTEEPECSEGRRDDRPRRIGVDGLGADCVVLVYTRLIRQRARVQGAAASPLLDCSSRTARREASSGVTPAFGP